MAVGIIIRGSSKKERYCIRRTPAQAVRASVSRENRQEYDNTKRAKEIVAKMPCGHVHAKAVAVAKMMGIPEHHARKMIESKSKVMLDGKID